MNFNPNCAPSPAPFKIPEPWEGYLTSETETTSGCQSLQSPDSGYTEMVMTKQEEDPFDFMEEEAVPYSDEYSFKNFDENYDFSDAGFPYSDQQEIEEFFEERSQCSKNESELEEVSSLSTDNGYDGADRRTNVGNESFRGFVDDSVLNESSLLEIELTEKAKIVLQHKSEEEKNYIDNVWPYLLTSLKEAFTQNRNMPLTNEMVGSLLEQLLYGKQAMIGAERVVLDNIVRGEMGALMSARPMEKVNMEELTMNTRKEKKAPKGNRNTSNLNHLNENYVSNIFQFAKRNYPEDKDVQRIGNERNISASNFKKMVQPKLNDNLETRKARARINGSGKELVGNIEYWMKDGYFDQCADRQKYLANKEKALRDLALSGKY